MIGIFSLFISLATVLATFSQENKEGIKSAVDNSTFLVWMGVIAAFAWLVVGSVCHWFAQMLAITYHKN